MHGRINPRYVGKVDQDLAAARSNLTLHTADFRTRLDDGEPSEVIFLHFAQVMQRETNAYHLAIMLSAAVLTLTEREAERERERQATEDVEFRLTEFELHVRTIGTMPVFEQVHVKCRGNGYACAVDSRPTTAHWRQVALDHLRRCTA